MPHSRACKLRREPWAAAHRRSANRYNAFVNRHEVAGLLRLLRLIRTFAGIARSLHHVPRLATHKGLIWLLAAWLTVMFLSSAALLYAAENGTDAAVDSPLDALWWGITTMTTVGYPGSTRAGAGHGRTRHGAA